MSPTVKGNTRAVTWGTLGGASGAFIGQGILTSISLARKADVFEHKDENNETIAAILHNLKDDLKIDIDTGTGSVLPAQGDTITVYGVTGYVVGCEKKGSRGAVQGITVTANKWAGIA